jgi:DNA repair protein RadC
MKPIEELPRFDKPREKLAAKGAAALRDEELMAILLGSGVRGKAVHRLAGEIVTLMRERFERLDLESLLAVHGLGPAKASQILAAVELARRFLLEEEEEIRITSAADVYTTLKPYAAKKQEHFILLTLDGASRLIGRHTLFIGTLNQSLVHPREVFAEALNDRAAGIIVAHNHPSGVCLPSDADRRITSRLRDGAQLLGIELLDHVIIAKSGYYSFSEEGEL